MKHWPAPDHRLVEWHKKTFGEGNVFLEITHHPEIEGEEYLLSQTKKLAQKRK